MKEVWIMDRQKIITFRHGKDIKEKKGKREERVTVG